LEEEWHILKSPPLGDWFRVEIILIPRVTRSNPN
jgi:hypothetical protein